jgi:hypothetical protein
MENEVINLERVVWSVIMVSMICVSTRARTHTRGETAEASGGISEWRKSAEQWWHVRAASSWRQGALECGSHTRVAERKRRWQRCVGGSEQQWKHGVARGREQGDTDMWPNLNLKFEVGNQFCSNLIPSKIWLPKLKKFGEKYWVAVFEMKNNFYY